MVRKQSLFYIFQNISGAFTAIINLLSIAIAPNKRTAAIYYFITALFVLLACFDTYFALPLNVGIENRNMQINLYSVGVTFRYDFRDFIVIMSISNKNRIK